MLIYISYTRLTFQEWKRWLFYLRSTNQHKQNEETLEYFPNKIRSQKKKLMK